MEDLSISEQLLYTTIRIECEYENKKYGTGTGFFFKVADQGGIIPTLITNKHVIKGASVGRLIFCAKDETGKPDDLNHCAVTLDNFEDCWTLHPEPDVDLCLMPIGAIIKQAKLEYGKELYYRMFDQQHLPNEAFMDQVTSIEDIIMIGYPDGIWDKKNNKPIFRKGITATDIKFDYNGKKEFLIDAACFPGSSGSPVVLLNQGVYSDRKGNVYAGGVRVALLGILYAGPQHFVSGEIKTVDIPMGQKNVALSSIPNNLGCVIKAERVKELGEALKKRIRMNDLEQQ